MLGLNVTYIMKPGMREEFLRRLEEGKFRQAALGDAGCLGYDYYCSVEDEDVLLLVERWTDLQAQQAHLQQPHMALVRSAKDACVAETRLEQYEM